MHMLTILITVAAAYLLYTWGVRLHLRSQIARQPWLDACAYACSMAAGTVVALSASMNLLTLLWPHASVIAISVVSTALAILLGEASYARSSRLSLRLLAPLRSKEQER